MMKVAASKTKAKRAFDRQVFGDFEVCPFTRRRPGIMQMVCIAGASNLTVRDGPE